MSLQTLTSVMQNLFFKYLVANYASNGFTNSLYLQTVQAGTEVFTGSNAKLTTSAYSIVIN
jgi:xyloglucan-specific endo-beta-1,4-glucanase